VCRHISQIRQAIILLVLALPAIGGMVGLASAQTPADAAATPGAVGLPYRNAVNNPPSAGPDKGGSNFVGMIRAESSPAITGITSPPPDCIVALSPTAGPAGSSPANYNSALFVGGNSLVSAPGCGVQVNSTTPGSLWIYWGSILTPDLGDAAPTYGCGTTEGVPVGTGDPGCYDPYDPIVTMYPNPSPPIADPLSYLSPPPSTACDSGHLYVLTGGANNSVRSYSITPGEGDVPSCPDIVITQSPTYGSSHVLFHQGTYHSITMGSCPPPYGSCYLPDAKVIFAPGVYNIMGSVPNYSDRTQNYYCLPQQLDYGYTSSPPPCGLSIIGSGAAIQGRNVVFYLGPSAGGVVMDGYFCSGCTSNLIVLAAPTTGDYAGILLYQDRSNANPACIGGCSSFPTEEPSSFLISGAMYFPDAGLYYTGCCEGTNVANTYQIAVASTLYLEFDNFYSDYSALPGGSPVGRPTQ